MGVRLTVRVLRTRATALVAIIMLALLLGGAPDATAVNTVSVPDSIGDVGKYASIALDSSDNPVVSYYDLTNGDLKVLHCGDPLCSAGNSIVTPDTGGDVGRYTSIVLDANGYPVVSYHDVTNQDLRILRCGDENCASGNSIISPDTIGNVGVAPSLQLDSMGNPVVAHYDLGTRDLRVLHCGDATCSAGNTITTLDTLGDVGDYPSLVLDGNGYPVISYFDRTNGDLKILVCNDPSCSGNDEVMAVPDVAGVVGSYTSLELDSSGNPVVSYWDVTNLDVKLLHCGNADCTLANSISSLDVDADVGPFTSLELDGNGNPVISYFDIAIMDLKVVHCGDPNCTAAGQPIVAPDTEGAVGLYTALSITTSGVPVVGFYDSTNGDLRVLSCPECDLDSDADGCTDAQEGGSDETMGGLRDPANPWDFYDVLGPGAALPIDGIIDLPNDVLGVVQHFAPTGAAPYDVQFDRGPSSGPNPWNMTAPDGVIDLPNDILGLIIQFGHSCQ